MSRGATGSIRWPPRGPSGGRHGFHPVADRSPRPVRSTLARRMNHFESTPHCGLSATPTRRIHVYGVGCPKSGTQSLARMFAGSYRSTHEPFAQQLIAHILAVAEHSDQAPRRLADFVRRIESEHAWEMNSSQLNVYFLDQLVAEHLDARFILTIRDCYSWLDSYINHHLRQPASEGKRRLRILRHRPDLYPHRPEERALADKGLFSLDGCLSFWAWHIRTVLRTVPRERLWIVRTPDLGSDLQGLAAFLGVPAQSLDRDASHSHRADQRFHLLDELDRSFLEARVQEHCGPLMAQWFPSIRCLTDAGIA